MISCGGGEAMGSPWGLQGKRGGGDEERRARFELSGSCEAEVANARQAASRDPKFGEGGNCRTASWAWPW